MIFRGDWHGARTPEGGEIGMVLVHWWWWGDWYGAHTQVCVCVGGGEIGMVLMLLVNFFYESHNQGWFEIITRKL